MQREARTVYIEIGCLNEGMGAGMPARASRRATTHIGVAAYPMAVWRAAPSARGS